MPFLLSSSYVCFNADKDFPDFEGGTTAYFAYQNPVRTLILGNDIYDNTLDNAHKCQIWSTMGGAYGGRDAYVEIAVDETLWLMQDGDGQRGKIQENPRIFQSVLPQLPSLCCKTSDSLSVTPWKIFS